MTPSRPWWQMTARRTLSRVIGAFTLLLALSLGVRFLGAALGSASSLRSLERTTLPEAIIDTVLAATLAFLYLNSAARLPKPEPRVPEPRFRPKVKLD